VGDKIQVEIREIDDRGKLSLVPVEVLEREAAGEDLGGGEPEDRPGIRADRSGGDRPQRDRGEGGGGDRGRTRQRSRGGHRD
jgi:polyribonucleotide nucleotidyltransferase